MFLEPASSAPPGSVILRAFKIPFKFDGCIPYDASRSCE